jgi:hypothetical protein
MHNTGRIGISSGRGLSDSRLTSWLLQGGKRREADRLARHAVGGRQSLLKPYLLTSSRHHLFTLALDGKLFAAPLDNPKVR